MVAVYVRNSDLCYLVLETSLVAGDVKGSKDNIFWEEKQIYSH